MNNYVAHYRKGFVENQQETYETAELRFTADTDRAAYAFAHDTVTANINGDTQLTVYRVDETRTEVTG